MHTVPLNNIRMDFTKCYLTRYTEDKPAKCYIKIADKLKLNF